jgi:hypothetical protein
VTEDNAISGFPAPEFAIRLFCDACGHQADLDRAKVPGDVAIHALTQRLRCTGCGGRECSIRIIYVEAGGFWP